MMESFEGNDDEDGAALKDLAEQLLPIANVCRIMKKVLSPNAKVSKEARATMQECVSEFISFMTNEASDKCKRERRKTISGEDVCLVMSALSFDFYDGAMRRFLQRYRELAEDKSSPERNNADGIDRDCHRDRPSDTDLNRNLAESSTTVSFIQMTDKLF